MHVVRQYYPGIDMKGTALPHMSYRITQYIDMPDQQIAFAFQEIDGEKIAAARQTVSSIIRHGAIIPRRFIRRKALRFSALPLIVAFSF